MHFFRPLLARRAVTAAARLPTSFTTAGSNAIFSVQQRRLLSDDLRSNFDKVIKENKLVVFMKGTPKSPQCGFSKAVIQVLEYQGVDEEKLKTINVLENEEVRNGIKEYSSWPTIPQIYVQGDFIGGCDAVFEMHKNGELEALLAKEGLTPPLDEPLPEKE